MRCAPLDHALLKLGCFLGDNLPTLGENVSFLGIHWVMALFENFNRHVTVLLLLTLLVCPHNVQYLNLSLK